MPDLYSYQSSFDYSHCVKRLVLSKIKKDQPVSPSRSSSRSSTTNEPHFTFLLFICVLISGAIFKTALFFDLHTLHDVSLTSSQLNTFKWHRRRQLDLMPSARNDTLLFNSLFDLQFPPDCAAPERRFLYFAMRSRDSKGLGAVLDHIIAALSLAQSLNRTLVVQTAPRDAWFWAKNACRQRSYLCYFEPVSACSERHWHGHWPVPVHRVTSKAHASRLKVLLYAHPTNYFEVDRCVLCDSYRLEALPFDFVHTRHDTMDTCVACQGSRLWLQAKLLSFFFRPAHAVLQQVENTKNHLKWHSEIHGFHIRRGDKVKTKWKEAEQHSFDEYCNFLEQLNEESSTVYIATDEPNILDEVNASLCANSTQKTFLLTDRDREEFGATFSADVLKKNIDRTKEIFNAIEDLVLLSECRFFVGSLSSFFTRNVLRLRLNRIENMQLFTRMWKSVDRDPFAYQPGWPYRYSYLQ